jgi:hypothetical protein
VEDGEEIEGDGGYIEGSAGDGDRILKCRDWDRMDM